MDGATLLVRCRERAGLTQRELARRAGTSAAAVCLYERGDRVPRIDTLMRLVAATGSTLELAASGPSGVDIEANARVLEDVLGLVDAVPHRRRRAALEAPQFAALAKGRGR